MGRYGAERSTDDDRWEMGKPEAARTDISRDEHEALRIAVDEAVASASAAEAAGARPPLC